MTEIPADLADFLSWLDEFIEREIKPLEAGAHRVLRPPARVAANRLGERRRPSSGMARAAGRDAPALPSGRLVPLRAAQLDGRARRHEFRHPADSRPPGGEGARAPQRPAERGLGRRQPRVPVTLDHFGTPEQKQQFMAGAIAGEAWFGFNLTEPNHGSDATWLETRAVADGSDWVINGAKRFASGAGIVEHAIVFARTSGEPGDALGITAFIVDTSDPGYEIPYFHWTFNTPSRPRRGCARRRTRPAERDPRRGGARTPDRAVLRPREPDPPGGIGRRRGRLLRP